MEKKEFKVGEEFQCGLIRLRCEKAKSTCVGCIFFDVDGNNNCSNNILGDCDSNHREDNNNVIFVKIGESINEEINKETLDKLYDKVNQLKEYAKSMRMEIEISIKCYEGVSDKHYGITNFESKPCIKIGKC